MTVKKEQTNYSYADVVKGKRMSWNAYVNGGTQCEPIN